MNPAHAWRRRGLRFFALAVGLLVSIAPALTRAASFTGLSFTGLGTPGFSPALSGDGRVIAGTNPTALGEELFRWTADGGRQSVGLLPEGHRWSIVRGISDDGNVIVGTSTPPGGGVNSFLWTADDGVQLLDDLLEDNGQGRFLSSGVSGDGRVIVGQSSGWSGRAFRWTAEDGVQWLGDRDDARDASSDGSVIVGSHETSRGRQAFRWTAQGGTTTVSWGLGINGGATAVSSDGNVVVGFSFRAGPRAFQWTAQSGAQLLDLPPGDFLGSSTATDVSGDGRVIVGHLKTSDGDVAFRWTANEGMRTVRSLLEIQGVSASLAKWRLFNVTGISDDGRTLIGTGRNPDSQSEAWVATLDVPEPGAAAMLAGVGLSLLGVRRGRRVRHGERRAARCALPAALGAGLLVSAVPTPTRAAMFTGVGHLPGGHAESYVFGVSGDGRVVVGKSGSAQGLEAFRWTVDGGIQGLGDLPGGYTWSEARDVSADGRVIVGNSESTRGHEAFRWTAQGGMQGLGDLTGGGVSSEAHGVSADGRVIAGTSRSAQGNEAFRWTADGGMQGLGDLPGGGTSSEATRVSGDGRVIVGESEIAYGGHETFRWTADEGMQDLGRWGWGEATDVSDDGRVIVGMGASRWTVDGGRQNLANDSRDGAAHGVSGDGRVVVGSHRFDQGHEAFRWTADGGMRPVRELLESQGLGASLVGWHLNDAADVSDDGLTIVGDGFNPSGQREAWVATLDADIHQGDYNDDGQVEQGDLDLVLQNWGRDLSRRYNRPNIWINHVASLGRIDQGDLDLVLQNWGSTAAPDFRGSSVPEPGAAGCLGAGVLSLLTRRRTRKAHARSL